MFENNELKKLPKEPTPITLYRCSEDSTRESEQVGHAGKSVWWMPWH